jgi:Family of unknown function (DUF6088)
VIRQIIWQKINMLNKPTVYERIIDRMSEMLECNVFLRQDFADLGSYSQVGSALKQLCEEEKLKRIGQGLYGKTKICTVEPFAGKVILTKGLTQIAPEALTRLGYQLSTPQAVLDYNAGISTQVPTGRRLRIQGKRTKRKIGYDNMFVSYEYID